MKKERLKSFLYLLARDSVVTGAINRAIVDSRGASEDDNYSDAELEAWARARAAEILT